MVSAVPRLPVSVNGSVYDWELTSGQDLLQWWWLNKPRILWLGGPEGSGSPLHFWDIILPPPVPFPSSNR